MAAIDVYNPVAQSTIKKEQPAPRVADLAGKRVALYWNFKIGGDVALVRVQELLAEKYPTATFTSYRGTVGHMMRHMRAEDAADIAAKADVAIGSTGD